MSTRNIPAARGRTTNKTGHRVQGLKPADRSYLQQRAAEFYSYLPGSNEEVARRLGCSRIKIWRWRTGAEPTRLSRLGEEMLLLQKNGYNTAFVEAFVSRVRMETAVDSLTLWEVERDLVEAHHEEEEAGDQLNALQRQHYRGQDVDWEILRAAQRQIAATHRIAWLHLQRHRLRQVEAAA